MLASILGLALALVTPAAHARTGDYSASVIGSSPAAVDANFQTVIYNNLAQSANPTAVINNLSDQEVADLVTIYTLRAGSTAAIEGVLSSRAPGVYPRFMRIKAAPPPPVPPSPSIYYTLEEIYLDFRTAPIGSMNVTEALVETSVYAVGHLTLSYTVGDIIGTGVGFLWQKFAPEAWNTFGGTIDQMLTNIADYWSDTIYAGKQMAGLLTKVGDNVWSMVNDTGDFGDYGGLDDMGYALYCDVQNHGCNF